MKWVYNEREAPPTIDRNPVIYYATDHLLARLDSNTLETTEMQVNKSDVASFPLRFFTIGADCCRS